MTFLLKLELGFSNRGVCVCQIPQEMMLQACSSYVLADAQPLPLHALGVNRRGERVDYCVYLEDNVQCLLRDTAEKGKGWHSAAGPPHTELAYKKVHTHTHSVLIDFVLSVCSMKLLI